jgi:hypothetical protein
MTTRVREIRRRLATEGPPRTRPHERDFETVSLPGRDCDLLRDLLIAEQAQSVVEVGLAYAASALAIGEALTARPAPRHVIIDPFQETGYAGVRATAATASTRSSSTCTSCASSSGRAAWSSVTTPTTPRSARRSATTNATWTGSNSRMPSPAAPRAAAAPSASRTSRPNLTSGSSSPSDRRRLRRPGVGLERDRNSPPARHPTGRSTTSSPSACRSAGCSTRPVDAPAGPGSRGGPGRGGWSCGWRPGALRWPGVRRCRSCGRSGGGRLR